jgi:hypothetical protein
MATNRIDLSRAAWRKSIHSGGNGNCVELASVSENQVAVRDSKRPEGPALVFGGTAWAAFADEIKQGRHG